MELDVEHLILIQSLAKPLSLPSSCCMWYLVIVCRNIPRIYILFVQIRCAKVTWLILSGIIRRPLDILIILRMHEFNLKTTINTVVSGSMLFGTGNILILFSTNKCKSLKVRRLKLQWELLRFSVEKQNMYTTNISYVLQWRHNERNSVSNHM